MADAEVIIVEVDDEEEAQDLGNLPDFEIFKDKETEEEFKGYLASELKEAHAERAPMFDKLQRWRRMADNQNVSGREPAWEGASDINVPVIPILLKTATSRLRNTFNARKPFWSIRALNEEAGNPWIDRAAVLQKYYNIISDSRYDLNLYAVNNKIMTDTPISGTVHVKVPWTSLKRNVVMTGEAEDGTLVGDMEKTQVIHDGPEIVPFRVEDVLFRESFQEIQKAPWFGFTQHLDWYEVSLYRENGLWSNVDELENNGRANSSSVETYDNQNRNINAHPGEKESTMIWDIQEVWVYYDVDGDGMQEDIVCYYHEKTNTLLFADYNRLGVRPIRQIPFYMRPWAIEGKGLVEVSEDLQDEINGLHNMRNDGIQMTEVPQWAVRRGSGIRPKEKVKPGKVWFLDDPTADIRLLQSSKSYIETANLESLDYTYLERVTGIQDIAGGFSSMLLKSRDTASSQGLRLQAGSDVFMGIIEGMDLAYRDIAELIFRQLVAHKDEVVAKERKAERLSQEDVDILEEILSKDIDEIPYVLAFKARIVEEAETYEGKRQSLMTLVAVYQQFAESMVPLVAQTYGDIEPMIVKGFMAKFVEGGTNLMEKVFQFFGEPDVDDYMMSADKIETMNSILAQMMQQNQMIGGVFNENGQQQLPGGTPGPVQPGGGGLGGGQIPTSSPQGASGQPGVRPNPGVG